MTTETPTPEVPAPIEAAPAAATPETPAPAETPAAAEASTETPAPQTLLGEAEPAPESPPAEAPKPEEQPAPEGEPKPEGESDQSEQAPSPTYEPFTLPEGFTPDAERLTNFTNLLAEAELAKGDHGKMQDFGQKLVDYHVAEMQATAQRVQDSLTQQWNDTLKSWADQTRADEELGGNRLNTSLQAASRFIREVGGTAEQQTAFRQLMEETGLGNHPVMLGFLSRGMAALGEGRPMAAPNPTPKPKTKAETLYGKKG